MADTHGGELAVDIRGLIKSFGHTRALDGLDLSVAAGSVTGFLGPNGAGKSTAIRVLLGLLRADRGTVRLLGGDPWRDAVNLHRRIAYVPGDVTIWPNLTGMQAMDFLARLRGTDERMTLPSVRLMRAEADVDCTKARRELGWQPAPVQESVREAARFWVGMREARRKARA